MFRLFVDIMSAIIDSLAGAVVKSKLFLIPFAVLMAIFFIPFAIWWEEWGKHKYKPWW